MPEIVVGGDGRVVRHTGGIVSWMSAVVESNQRVSRRALDPAPENSVDLIGWYLAALGRTLHVLGSAQPDSETWTFSSTGKFRLVGKYRTTDAVQANDAGRPSEVAEHHDDPAVLSEVSDGLHAAARLVKIGHLALTQDGELVPVACERENFLGRPRPVGAVATKNPGWAAINSAMPASMSSCVLAIPQAFHPKESPPTALLTCL